MNSEKIKLDDWYNSLPNRMKENIPHWRESDYNQRLILHNEAIKQMEQALRDINFFVGGLSDEGIEYYYNKLISK